MATTPKAATPAKPVKKKPRKLSTAQLAARIARDSAELAKRAGKPTTKAKAPAKK